MSQESYSVAALAAAVGVPRTTINDWLSRYADYIDCTAVGKRKVYSSGSLAVLQEIARLRDAGKSSTEIENILAQNHGVRPEVAVPTEENEAQNEEAAGETAPTSALAVTTPAGDNQLPALKNIEQSAMELAGFIAELQKNQIRSVKRSRQLNWIMFSGIVILLAAIVFIYTAMQREAAGRREDAQKAQADMIKLNNALQQEAAGRREDAQKAQADMIELNNSLQQEAAGRREDAQKARADMMQLNNSLQQEAAGRREDARKARQENEKLLSQVKQLNQQTARQNDQLEKLTGKVSDMESERRSEQLAAQEREAERQKLEQELNTLRQEREKALHDKAVAEQAAAEQKKAVESKDAIIAGQSKDMQENKRKLDDLQKKIEATNAQLDRQNSLLEQFMQQDKSAGSIPAADSGKNSGKTNDNPRP